MDNRGAEHAQHTDVLPIEKRKEVLKDFLKGELSALRDLESQVSGKDKESTLNSALAESTEASNEFIEAMLGNILAKGSLSTESLNELSGLFAQIDTPGDFEQKGANKESIEKNSNIIDTKLHELSNKTVQTLYTAGRSMYAKILKEEARENRTARATYVAGSLVQQTTSFFGNVPVANNVVDLLAEKAA